MQLLMHGFSQSPLISINYYDYHHYYKDNTSSLANANPFEFLLLCFSTALDIFEAITDSGQQNDIPDQFRFSHWETWNQFPTQVSWCFFVVCNTTYKTWALGTHERGGESAAAVGTITGDRLKKSAPF